MLIVIVAPNPILETHINHHGLPKIPIIPKYAIEVVQIDESFTDQEKFLISQAASAWETATNHIVKFVFVYGNSFNFKLKIEKKPIMINLFHLQPADEDEMMVVLLDSQLHADCIGYYDGLHMIEQDRTIMFVVRSRVQSEDEYKAIIMHEIGHSLGLNHSNNTDDLMFRAVSGFAQCITIGDLTKFCKIYNCNVEELNPCFKTTGPVCLAEDSESP